MRYRPVAIWSVLAAPLVIPTAPATSVPIEPVEPILGVDLSYVNEIEDCGGQFRDGSEHDPFTILAGRGANLVRARLWNDPNWTDYSTVDDVIRTFQRAEAAGMETLLDFHYSDEWADPSRQNPPAAWTEITDVDELADALGTYTTETLEQFDAAGVLPNMVQVGNETNGGLVKDAVGLDWSHDLALFEAGTAAVRAVAAATGQPIDVVIHVAQPENALDWFEQAAVAGLADFDVIGLSYYPQWSSFSIPDLGSAVHTLSTTYDKDVLVVETGYPWTLDSADDSADNILDQALRGYELSPTGQAAMMTDLNAAVVANGGLGTVYWEPAWLSTSCRTRWGQGSHWENATLFDFDGTLHTGADYLAGSYRSLNVPDAGDAISVSDAVGDAGNRDADLTAVAAVADEHATAVTASFAGDVRQWPGSLIMAIDNVVGSGGDGGRRPYDFADDERPDLLVEAQWKRDPGAGYFALTPLTWIDDEWQPTTFTGRVEVGAETGGGTTVTWVLPSGIAPRGSGVTVVAAQRGRAGALADVVEPGAPDLAVPMLIEVASNRVDQQETAR